MAVCLVHLRFCLAALCEGAILHPLPLHYGTIVAIGLRGMSSFDVCHWCEALCDLWDQQPERTAMACYSGWQAAALV